MQPRSSSGKPFDHPAGEAEQTQFLARGRIDGQPVRIVGIPLGAADFLGVAVAPDGALAQQPMRGEPPAGEHQRRPPREAKQHGRRGKTANHADEAAGDEIHRVRQRRARHAEVEVARDREVGGKGGIFQVCHTRRAGACPCQAVVEKRRGAVAEVVADRRLNWRQHLQQDEGGADEAQWTDQALTALDGADEDAHRNGEQGRQDAMKQDDGPPRQREPAVGPRQGREELPFLPFPQTLDHWLFAFSGIIPDLAIDTETKA